MLHSTHKLIREQAMFKCINGNRIEILKFSNLNHELSVRYLNGWEY
jgi:hypothetical protein